MEGFERFAKLCEAYSSSKSKPKRILKFAFYNCLFETQNIFMTAAQQQ
jgi:hypothetical protein